MTKTEINTIEQGIKDIESGDFVWLHLATGQTERGAMQQCNEETGVIHLYEQISRRSVVVPISEVMAYAVAPNYRANR